MKQISSCCKSTYQTKMLDKRRGYIICDTCGKLCTLEDIPVKTEDRWNDFYMDKGVYPLHRNRIMFYPEDVVDFIKSERELLVEKIKEYDYKEKHFCRFNDGECDCDCYLKAREDIIKLIQEK